MTALLASAALLGAPRPGRAQTPTIRIGGAINDSYAQPFFALEQGFFTKAGLSVDLQTFANAPSMVQAVIGNAIDVGMADPIQIANAANHGIPLAFFAGGGLYLSRTPTTYLCVAKNSPIKSPKELAGQSVAVIALSSTGASAMREWLRANGTDPATVKVYELPFASMVPALERGTVAAALVAEPFMSMEKAAIRPLGDPQSVIAPEFYVAASFARRDWIARNRPLAQRLTAALYDTARWSNAHHDDSAVVLAKYTKIELPVVRQMTRVTYSTSLEPRLMQPILDFAVKIGTLEKPVDASDIIVTP